MNYNNEENWIGTEEAAQYLDVKVTTLRKWLRGKKYQLIKLGNCGSLKNPN